MSDTLVKFVFLFMILGSPLGILSWIGLRRAAKKKQDAGNELEALRLKTKASLHLTTGLIEALLGPLGYYLVSKGFFPQKQAIWVLLPSTL